MKMLPVKIIASLSLVVFGAINCKPNSGSVDEQSTLNALDSQESVAASDEGAAFALADQAADAQPCPNPAAGNDKVEVY